jgi:TonB family protein
VLTLLALVLLLAPDTTTFVPGTPLRFGMRLAAAEAKGFTGSAEGGGRTGTCRFFGLPCEGTLFFTDERLVRAEFAVSAASDYEERYVEDELRRQGYRRDCMTLNATQSDCVWNGRTRLALTVAGQTMKAVAEPFVAATPAVVLPASATNILTRAPSTPKRDAPAAAKPTLLKVRPDPPVRTNPAPSLPPRGNTAARIDSAATATTGHSDSHAVETHVPPPRAAKSETLSVASAPLRTRFAHVRAQHEEVPLYPEAARRAGVQGRVWVMALVAHDGHVLDASITRGIPELNRAALSAVMRWRFPPVEGSTSTYWVEIPVRFRLF